MSFEIVKKFEDEIARFYGSPYAVAVDSCTHSIELCLRYNKVKKIIIPKHTYLSIAFLANKIGIDLEWKDENWVNYYYLGETNIIDAAVLWKRNSYISGTLMCLSFQYQKHLSLGRGGMILTDDKKARDGLKRMSYDGRDSDIPWRNQNIKTVGYHYYMTPETAQLGLDKLPEAIKTEPKRWVIGDWPDLQKMDVFK
ncbi:MAG: hypothetical protein CMG74_13320 [Candidatus Marinimicrobia bacterium]|nr:hypothetical protein [Candidatus Neomarinimicrobiota bacterium]|tara:strand:- start:39 stop:629 length:591 start_codon:yes stop_codon:yes gene_type:complete